MLRALVCSANHWFNDWNRALRGERFPALETLDPAPVPLREYQPLQRVLLTDGVGQTLFEEYAAHRATPRGEEETGWVLLGVREAKEAVVLATLPAGAERSAGEAHVRFNSNAQALASRMVRQHNKRLVMLGVVHTHPGSLRHPSDGDYRGDILWVGQLRGREGVFGIGTADGLMCSHAGVARQPQPHVQTLGPQCFSWYVLGEDDHKYRQLPVDLTLGPDLARPLHAVWQVIEAHAERLDRLYRQQAGVTSQVVEGKEGLALEVSIPLAEPGASFRVHLEGKVVRYYLVRDGELVVADPQTSCVDQGVYLLLAQLAAQ